MRIGLGGLVEETSCGQQALRCSDWVSVKWSMTLELQSESDREEAGKVFTRFAL